MQWHFRLLIGKLLRGNEVVPARWISGIVRLASLRLGGRGGIGRDGLPELQGLNNVQHNGPGDALSQMLLPGIRINRYDPGPCDASSREP